MEKIYKGEIQRLLPIFQAMADGRVIQFAANGNDWIDIDGEEEGLFLDTLIDNPQYYRIKPEPKYRPFKNTEECWKEMQKHQPFGWLISPNSEVNSLIIFIDNEGIVIGDRNNGVIGFATATDLFKIKFADGTPFGVKVENNV